MSPTEPDGQKVALLHRFNMFFLSPTLSLSICLLSHLAGHSSSPPTPLPSFAALPVVFVSLKTWLVSAPANLLANAWLDPRKKGRGSLFVGEGGIQAHWTTPSITVAEQRIIIGRTNWTYRTYGRASVCVGGRLENRSLWAPVTMAQTCCLNRLDTAMFCMLPDFGSVVICIPHITTEPKSVCYKDTLLFMHRIKYAFSKRF